MFGGSKKYIYITSPSSSQAPPSSQFPTLLNLTRLHHLAARLPRFFHFSWKSPQLKINSAKASGACTKRFFKTEHSGIQHFHTSADQTFNEALFTNADSRRRLEKVFPASLDMAKNWGVSPSQERWSIGFDMWRKWVKPNGYLFGDDYPSNVVYVKGFWDVSPWYRGFHPQPCSRPTILAPDSRHCSFAQEDCCYSAQRRGSVSGSWHFYSQEHRKKFDIFITAVLKDPKCHLSQKIFQGKKKLAFGGWNGNIDIRIV